MKKFFAIFAIVLLALALSSCSLLLSTTYEDDLEYRSNERDNDVFYYSALSIEVVSYIYEDDNGSSIKYELQIGLRNLAGEPLLDEDMAISLEGELSNKLGLGVFYIGSFNVPNYFLYGDSAPKSEYTYYCFRMIPSEEVTLIGDEAHYGFFYYGRDYTLTVPSWINSLRSNVDVTIRVWLNNNLGSFSEDYFGIYIIDPDAVRLRYYFGGANIEAKDAIWVEKTILSLDDSDYGMLSCLMWQAGEDYDFTSFSLSIEAMAPGWYIVPILLGSAVVVILFLVNKSKKVDHSVFRQVTAEKVDNENNSAANNIVNVVDGQISIEEYQDVQATSMENDNGN
ncbi:MAG: hypothetical protein J1F36_00840 [Clostridiales bacterium]|nr:hypothetical protein [Clostridiales bacterium]